MLLPAFHLHLYTERRNPSLGSDKGENAPLDRRLRASDVRSTRGTPLYECTKSEDTPGSDYVSRRPAAAAAGYDYINIAATAYDNRALARAAGCAEWGSTAFPLVRGRHINIWI